MSISVRSWQRKWRFTQLIFLLSMGYLGMFVHAAELPVLGSGKAINSAGQFIGTNANFAGGASVDGVSYQTRLQASPSGVLKGQGRITVDPSDVGKQADFLYVVGIESSVPFDRGIDTNYFVVTETKSYLPVDLYNEASVWMAQLAEAPFQRGVTLQNAMVVNIGDWQLSEKPSFSYSFIGYRLQNGTVVYTAIPVVVSTVTGSEGINPSFPGLVQLTSTDTDKISLAWLPAVDDNTPPESIIYQVHLSNQPNFTPSSTTLYAATVGQQQAEIAGLAKGQTYNVLIVAVDQDGNESIERDYRTVTTFTEPVIISKTTRFAEDKDLGLGKATTSDGVQFTYPSGGTSPQVGSVLFANVGEDMYLRKVDSVTPTADGGIVVQTSDAGLADVIEQGTIDTEMTSFDVDAEANRSGVRTSRSIRKDDSSYAVMRWQDDVLVAEQENFNQYGGRTTRDSEQEIGGSANATFTPSLRIKFSWHKELGRGIVITSGEVIARGQLSLDANAFYNFKGAAEAKKEVPLFESVFRTRHVLGGIHFFLRWVVNVKAVFSASASSEIKANVGANATAMIEMGARYNPATDAWETLPPTPSFEKSFKAGIDLQGGVHGEVRIVPNVQVDLYRTLTANLSVEPFITGDIAIQSIPKGELLKEFGYLPTQLSQFDLAFQLEGFVDLSLRFMTGFLKLSDKISLLDKTKIGELPKQMLFSLPELSVSGGSGKKNEPITLTATTKDGTNNPFQEGSVKWFVSPNKGTISGGKAGTFTSGEEGSYTVFFSGHSYLGDPMARQFAVAEVSVGKGDGKPRMAHGIPDNNSTMQHGIPDNTGTMQHGIPDNTQTMSLTVKDRCYGGGPTGEWRGNYVTIKENGVEREVQDGEWISGNNDGSFSVTTYSKGILNGYSGSWRADCKPSGWHGKYTNGKMDGVWFWVNSEDAFDSATYSNGVRQGPSGQWNADGTARGCHGNFSNDIQDGMWYCYDNKGKPQDWNGKYANGKMDGVWFAVNSDGSFASYTYSNGVRQGPSGEWNADGTARGCHGNFSNDQQDGMWYCYDNKGKPNGWSGKYTNGKMDGVWFAVNSDGSFASYTYSNGVRQGPSGEWNADGTARGCHGNFSNDQQDGMWYCYDNKGKPNGWSGKYTNGKMDGVWFVVNSDGSFESRTYSNNIEQGLFGQWNADGTARGCHGNYASNKQVGVWTCYKDDGTTYTETYVDGVRQ